ncbi:hypothetical protein HZ326_5750 [Fusarium oxysporum f. sp. albedinis]|nr:hypothetical protein HZ326_5750 [Fusarium oxysporum f. sp. albedinis]
MEGYVPQSKVPSVGKSLVSKISSCQVSSRDAPNKEKTVLAGHPSAIISRPQPKKTPPSQSERGRERERKSPTITATAQALALAQRTAAAYKTLPLPASKHQQLPFSLFYSLKLPQPDRPVVLDGLLHSIQSPGPVVLRCAAALCLSKTNALLCLIQRPQGGPKGATCISRPLPAHHAAANLAHHHASDRPCQDLPSHPPVTQHHYPRVVHSATPQASCVPASAFITCGRHCPGSSGILPDTGCTPE